jgi:tight adherence protein B
MPSLRRNDSDSGIVAVDRAVKRWLPRRAALRDRLARSGYNISVGSFVMVCGILLCAILLIETRMFGLPFLAALLLSFTVGVGIPYFAIGRLGARRLDKFNRLFPDGLDIMVRGLRSGMPLHDSITVVSREIGEPVGSEFRRIQQAVEFGQPLDLALAEAAQRIKTTEFQFFVVSLALQRETGGNLGETLSNLSDILRRRQQMKLKIKAMSSEARASAVIIGILPFAMFGILFMINQGYVMKLFTDSRGLIMTGAGLAAIAIGIGVMVKMMRFEI